MKKNYSNEWTFHRWLFMLLAGTFISAQAQAQYCLPTYGNQCTSGDFIDSFTLNTIANTGTGCSNPSANNYTDYTATISTTLDQGQSYTVTCAPGPSWGQYFVMWIDFNQDGDFDEVNEFFDIGYSAAGANIVNSITIPNGVASGNTQMRVMCHFGTGVISQPDACSSQTWGETEDYAVTIGSPPPFEAAMSSITSPVTGCGLGMEDVTIDFMNNGVNSIDTIILCYSANGGVAVCDTLTGLGLASGSSLSYMFPTQLDMTTPDDYMINTWLVLNQDSTPINDSIIGYLATSVPTIVGIPYVEDFESGTGGWVPVGTLSTWEYGVPAETNIFSDTTGACSRNNGWATGLTTPYNNNEVSFLESPCIDFSALTQDPYLRFDHLFQVEGTFEDHWVEVSIDGGATWGTLGANGTGINWYNQPANWDGVSYTAPGGWRVAQHELIGTAGESDVRIRFAFTSDGSVQQEGIAVDNIMIDNSFLDAYAIDLTSPVSNCGLTSTELVSANFFNNGSDTLFMLPVAYSINGGTPVTETIMDTILPNTAYAYDFTAFADLSVVGDYDFQFWTGLVGDGNTCNDTSEVYTVTNVLVVNSYPYQETFEGGQNGWTIDNSGNGTFAFGTPAKNTINSAGSGVNSFTTGGLGTGTYNVNEQSFVNGPCFDFTNLPANSWFSMRNWWNSENSWDGANLQISVDTGATWQNVGAFGDPNNWYNDNSISGGPGGSQEGWTGNAFNNGSGGWVWSKREIDSAYYGAPYVQLRVAFGSDGSVTDDGFAFDDFAISTPPSIDLGPDYVGCGTNIAPGLAGTYEWFVADTSVAPTFALAGTDPWFDVTNQFGTDTTYTVVVVYTDTFGLCASDTMLATVFPTPYTDLGPDTMTCYGDSVWFFADVDSFATYTYSWNNSTTTDSALYNLPGTVEVTVTNGTNMCSHTDSTHIISTLPIELGPDLQFCIGDSAILDAGPGYDTLVWTTGDSTQMIVVNSTNFYQVDGVDFMGCTSSDFINVVVSFLPSVSATIDSDSICQTLESATLDAGSGFSAYSWSTGGTSQTEVIDGSTLTAGQWNEVIVTVTDGNGCVNTDTIDLFVYVCISVEEQIGDYSLSYYPNPSNGQVFVTVEGVSNEAMKLEVLNIEGRVLEVHEMGTVNGTQNLTLDLESYSPGIYLIRIQTPSGTGIGRLIIE